MLNRKITVLLAVVASAGLAGCWDSAEVTVHEPGKYMGEKDPLLAKTGASRAESLQKRFQLVQADR